MPAGAFQTPRVESMRAIRPAMAPEGAMDFSDPQRYTSVAGKRWRYSRLATAFRRVTISGLLIIDFGPSVFHPRCR